MSRSDAGLARIELISSNPALELSIVASGFRVVERGVGGLSANVEPGIYQIVARAGPAVQRTLVKVGAGEVFRDAQVKVEFPAAAPVSDTFTSHDSHQEIVKNASYAITQQPGPAGGLLVVVRDVRGAGGPPLETPDLAPFTLLDRSLNPVPGFEQGWNVVSKEGIATSGARLEPGGYALRTDPARGAGNRRPRADSDAFDQSIWISAGWQTIVFVTTDEGGPRTSTASVHMAPISDGWAPYEPEVGQAVELANWGLREGRSVVPRDLVNLLLNVKFVNPMVGILGAHCLLLDLGADAGLVNVVLTNLNGLVPDHPDVAALRWIAAREGIVADPMSGAMESGGVTWPPMLLPSYRALIEMDVLSDKAIADDSVAERAAAQLYVQGIWTSWTPLETSTELPRGAATAAADAVLGAVSADPSVLNAVPTDDPATDRVAGYLAALAAFEGSEGRAERFAGLSSEEIALATTLPSASVERSLARIGSFLPPPTTPTTSGDSGIGNKTRGWIDGLSTGTLALIAAVVLLLGGGAGAVAWCAGSEDCPFRQARLPVATATAPTPQPTLAPQPTSAPTPEPTVPPTLAPTPEPTLEPTVETPPPIQLQLEPDVIDFGSIPLGATREQRFILRAPEPVEVRWDATAGLEPGYSICRWFFTDVVAPACIDANSCELTGAAPSPFECLLEARFIPSREIAFKETVDFFANAETVPHQLTLAGESAIPELGHEPRLSWLVSVWGTPHPQQLSITAPEELSFAFEILDDEDRVFSVDPCVWTADIVHRCTTTVYLTTPPEPLFPSPIAPEYDATLAIRVGDVDVSAVQLIGRWNEFR